MMVCLLRPEQDEAEMLARLIAGHTGRITRNCCPAQRRVSRPRMK